ncbi:MAG: ABC transporter ATP-binding protein [Deltaproteobacteria bacterium]|nr:MAG: ABC transporter ATP-binding protein [Deltaproteobacteria bacterium]
MSLEGVALRLGRNPVLAGVDLELARGEVLGLLGCNGAGKTTLLRLLTRVLRPDAGRIELAGRPLESYPRRLLAQTVAIVPQDTQAPFPFSAAEIVLMGRAPHRPALGFESASDVERARAAMRRVGIEALADRSILSLSGGERQLVMVARALVQDPELLLFDEPTAFLDLRHRVDVLGIVRDSVRAGRSALVVSHDLGLAARMCDRLAMLHEGRVVAAGTPADVLTPDRLRRVFGIEADVVPAPDGSPLVVPHRSAPSGRPTGAGSC